MRRLIALALVIFGFASAAEALTVRDIIELSRAGLGEEVLLALIDVDRGVYAIDNTTLKSLKEAGVSERVIVAMVRSGRERIPEPVPVEPPIEEARAPEPQVVVIDHHEPPQVREVMVPVPVYVAVDGSRSRFRRGDGIRHVPVVESADVPFQVGFLGARPVRQQPPPPPPKPVYWGFGGKLRPDAWQPDGYTRDDEKPRDK